MLRSWALPLKLEPDADIPIYIQVARAISREIRRGRLKPGSPLPGTRALSQLLKVHRNTITAAYEELTADGWTVSEPSRGTFVSHTLPPQASTWEIGRAITKNPPQPEKPSFTFPAAKKRIFHFSDGTADSRLVPVAELSVAFRRAIRKQMLRGWSYSDARGTLILREAVAEMLRSNRAVVADSRHIIITRGSQMALYLAGRAVLSADSVIAVEELGYQPAWDAFRSTGARVISVPIDEQGLNVQELKKLSHQQRIHAVYVTPHHQYPTAVSMSASRRAELLEWSNETGATIIEDDYDNEFHYEGSPLLPLASDDKSDAVVYVGTFSKMFAPGLRMGYVAASEKLISSMKEARRVIDRQGDTVLESAVAELILEGHLQRHLRKTRQKYCRRRDIFAKHLRELFSDQLHFAVPPGGMALWVRPTRNINTEKWSEAARKFDVIFDPSSHYSFHRDRYGGVRLGFAALTEAELQEASRLLWQSFLQSSSKRSR